MARSIRPHSTISLRNWRVGRCIPSVGREFRSNVSTIKDIAITSSIIVGGLWVVFIFLYNNHTQPPTLVPAVVVEEPHSKTDLAVCLQIVEKMIDKAPVREAALVPLQPSLPHAESLTTSAKASVATLGFGPFNLVKRDYVPNVSSFAANTSLPNFEPASITATSFNKSFYTDGIHVSLGGNGIVNPNVVIGKQPWQTVAIGVDNLMLTSAVQSGSLRVASLDTALHPNGIQTMLDGSGIVSPNVVIGNQSWQTAAIGVDNLMLTSAVQPASLTVASLDTALHPNGMQAVLDSSGIVGPNVVIGNQLRSVDFLITNALAATGQAQSYSITGTALMAPLFGSRNQGLPTIQPQDILVITPQRL